MEGQKGIRFLAAASFREDADGDAGFYFFDSGEDGLHALFDVVSVQKETVQIFHPVRKERHLYHADLCDVAGGPWHPHIGHDNVKIASVIADVENGFILWNVLFADHRDGYAGEKEDTAESPVDDG